MPATDLERLVVGLEGKIDKFEKAMAKAVATSNKSAKTIESRFDKLTNELNARLGTFGKNAFAGFTRGAASALIPTVTLVAAIDGARKALDKFGDIADKSAAAGVDPEFFQGIAYQASLAGVQIDGTADALATFNKNAGLAAEGHGKLVSQLKVLAPELLRQIQLAGTQEDRIRAVADALAKESDSSRQAAIAAAAFGDQGTKLVAIFKDGAAAVDAFVAKAKVIGVVVSRDLIARADEWGDKLDTVNQIISTRINSSLVELAPLMVTVTNLTADWLHALAIVADQFQAIENRQFINPLQNQLVAIENERIDLQQKMAELAAMPGSDDNPVLDRMQTKLERLTTQADQLLRQVQELQGYKPAVTPAAAPATPTVNPNTLGGADLGVLDLPASALGGGQAFGSVGSGAKAATEAVGPLDLGIESVGASLEHVDDIGRTVTDGLASGFSDVVKAAVHGENAIDAAAAAFGRLGDQLFDMASNQLIQSLLGSLLGGGAAAALGRPGSFSIGNLATYASGTGFARGGMALVGERGPELVRMPRGAQVLTARQTAGAMAGGNTQTFHIDARGAELGVEDRIVRAIKAIVPPMIDSQAPVAVAKRQRLRG